MTWLGWAWAIAAAFGWLGAIGVQRDLNKAIDKILRIENAIADDHESGPVDPYGALARVRRELDR